MMARLLSPPPPPCEPDAAAASVLADDPDVAVDDALLADVLEDERKVEDGSFEREEALEGRALVPMPMAVFVAVGEAPSVVLADADAADPRAEVSPL
jgi:hypothetical protein